MGQNPILVDFLSKKCLEDNNKQKNSKSAEIVLKYELLIAWITRLRPYFLTNEMKASQPSPLSLYTYIHVIYPPPGVQFGS